MLSGFLFFKCHAFVAISNIYLFASQCADALEAIK